jgi:hypothetical protein
VFNLAADPPLKGSGSLDPGTTFYPCRTLPVTFYFVRLQASASGL